MVLQNDTTRSNISNPHTVPAWDVGTYPFALIRTSQTRVPTYQIRQTFQSSVVILDLALEYRLARLCESAFLAWLQDHLSEVLFMFALNFAHDQSDARGKIVWCSLGGRTLNKTSRGGLGRVKK